MSDFPKGGTEPGAVPPNGVTEQEISVQHDAAHQCVYLSIRGRFDIRPTITVIPYTMLDMMYWQKLTNELAVRGQLPGVQIGGTTGPVGVGPSTH